ncbi:MAG: PEP-CTERM sorting domain-containing protein [Acidobacteria bacterium]|nr:PEP-CTERM sorting domain-containing protein [Acidobacteriota bacterium]
MLFRTGGPELWAITSGAFPTTPGNFSFVYADVMFGFAGDIQSGGGSISPEPASLLLFGTGLAAIGIWRRRRSTPK